MPDLARLNIATAQALADAREADSLLRFAYHYSDDPSRIIDAEDALGAACDTYRAAYDRLRKELDA